MVKAFVFAGQGSQKKGMGKDLFDLFPDIVAKTDEILGYSIRELCLNDTGNNLNLTQYTQPALYVVNALIYFDRMKKSKENPDYFAGHSLGEYNALMAAGAFDFETGLRLVQKRGELIGKAKGGGMAAVIGLDEKKLKDVLDKNNLNKIDVANFNTPTQIVISGLREDIKNVEKIFKDAGARMCIPLKVSGAFHSRYMKEAEKEFALFLENFNFSKLSVPVISNVEARPYSDGEVKKLLAEQITHSVKWTESVQYLMGKGLTEFEELSPGSVLTGLIKKIQREAKPLIINEDIVKEDSKGLKKATAFNKGEINATLLGNQEFKKDYNIKYAYVAGSMYKGISSKELVVKMGNAGLIAYLGTGGMALHDIEEAIQYIQQNLGDNQAYGVNLLYNLYEPGSEEKMINLFLKFGVHNIEVSAYMQMTQDLIHFRLKGIFRNKEGKIITPNQIMAKISRPEIADLFMSPPTEKMLQKLMDEGKISTQEAELGKEIPLSDCICAEADSGGHTDQAAAYALLPAIISLRNEKMKKHGYKKNIKVGAAGGIGTPEAAAAAFVMGADFILTGSINQCTVEAGTSDVVKNMLQSINVQDTAYAPAGDMFELGAKVQVLKKGVFFPARANKLFDIYTHYDSLDEIDEKTKKQIQEKYFKRSFDEIWEDTKTYWNKRKPDEIKKAERNPKHKMSLILRWYFGYSTWMALTGNEEHKVNYQIHCGPALGSFNQWVKGTKLENWQNRHVNEIAVNLMEETALLLNKRFKELKGE